MNEPMRSEDVPCFPNEKYLELPPDYVPPMEYSIRPSFSDPYGQFYHDGSQNGVYEPYNSQSLYNTYPVNECARYQNGYGSENNGMTTTIDEENRENRDHQRNGNGDVQIGGSANVRNNRGKWKKIICASICLFILVVIVTLPILYLVRRDVSFDIVPINIEEETINIDPNGFNIPVNPTIHTKNENFFDISLNSVKVEGSHPSYANGVVPLGMGTIEQVILFKRSEMDFQFPFLVQYNRTFDPSAEYFTQLLTNCTNVDPNGRNLYLDVSVMVEYHTWVQSGVINENRNIVIPCPISSEQATKILQLVQTGIV